MAADPAAGLAGKVAVITGSASLIGAATARLLIERGAEVLLADSDVRGEEVAKSTGARFELTDVTLDAHLDRLVARAVDELGRIDVLVTAAASFADSGLASTRAQFLDVLDVNLVAAAVLTHKASQHMEPGSAVTYVASVSGSRSQPSRVVYNVSKAGLLMLAKSAAHELAPRGIRVNAVSPGWTWSRNIARRYGSRERADAFAAEFQPLGRMADPEEVAQAIVFLSSAAASFTTGSELLVDGGYLSLGPEALGQAAAKVPPLETS